MDVEDDYPEVKMSLNNHNDIKIIRITKQFSMKDKKPENIMLVTKGTKKIQYTLNNKISPKNILFSLKTIQSNPIYKEDDNIYFSSLQNNQINKNRANIYHQRKANALKKFFSKEEENENNDIYDIKIDNNEKKKRTRDIKRITYNSNLIHENNASFKSLKNEGKTSYKNSEMVFNMNKTMFSRDKKNKNIIRQKNRLNTNYIFSKIKKVMTINNVRNHINLAENTNDKISNLVNIKNNKLLFENENTINFADKEKDKKYDKSCFICEKIFVFPNIYFAKCKIHFFCKNCLKIYCHELISKGVKKIKCPVYKCNYDIDEVFLKKTIDEHCYDILFENKKEDVNKNKKDIVKEISNKNKIWVFNIKSNKIELYNTKKNLIDVNSNLTLYNVRKSNNEYCSNCHEHSLFTIHNSLFNKCLNCGIKICKYCNKQFSDNHLVMEEPDHCKIYSRRKKIVSEQNKPFLFLMQLIYTVGMFVISFFFCFLCIRDFFSFILGNKTEDKNYLKCIVCYFLSICLYLFVLPFFIILIPFFPNISAMTDGY